MAGDRYGSEPDWPYEPPLDTPSELTGEPGFDGEEPTPLDSDRSSDDGLVMPITQRPPGAPDGPTVVVTIGEPESKAEAVIADAAELVLRRRAALIVGIVVIVLSLFGAQLFLVTRAAGVPLASAAPTPSLAVASSTPSPLFGRIVFGTTFDKASLSVPEPSDSFAPATKAIAWSAMLRRAVGDSSVKLIVTERVAAGSERGVVTRTYRLDPFATIVADRTDLAGWAGHRKGTYVMRLIQSGETFAEGEFVLR